MLTFAIECICVRAHGCCIVLPLGVAIVVVCSLAVISGGTASILVVTRAARVSLPACASLMFTYDRCSMTSTAATFATWGSPARAAVRGCSQGQRLTQQLLLSAAGQVTAAAVRGTGGGCEA